jgi:hypothetical protein
MQIPEAQALKNHFNLGINSLYSLKTLLMKAIIEKKFISSFIVVLGGVHCSIFKGSYKVSNI